MLYSYSSFSNSRTTNLGEDLGFCPVLGIRPRFLFHGSLDHEPPNPQTPKANPSGQKPPFWGHLWRVCMRVPLIVKELSRHKRQDSDHRSQNNYFPNNLAKKPFDSVYAVNDFVSCTSRIVSSNF